LVKEGESEDQCGDLGIGIQGDTFKDIHSAIHKYSDFRERKKHLAAVSDSEKEDPTPELSHQYAETFNDLAMVDSAIPPIDPKRLHRDIQKSNRKQVREER
jgi:hypothetical protein